MVRWNSTSTTPAKAARLSYRHPQQIAFFGIRDLFRSSVAPTNTGSWSETTMRPRLLPENVLPSGVTDSFHRGRRSAIESRPGIGLEQRSWTRYHRNTRCCACFRTGRGGVRSSHIWKPGYEEDSWSAYWKLEDLRFGDGVRATVNSQGKRDSPGGSPVHCLHPPPNLCSRQSIICWLSVAVVLDRFRGGVCNGKTSGMGHARGVIGSQSY